LNLFVKRRRRRKPLSHSLSFLAQPTSLFPSFPSFPAAQNLLAGPFFSSPGPTRRPVFPLYSPIGATPSPSPLSAARGPPVGGLLLPPVRAGLQLKESSPSTRRRPAVLARTPRSPAPPLFKALHPPEPYRIEPPPSSLRTALAAAAAIVGLAWSSVTPPFPPLPVDFKPPRSFAPR